MSFADIKNNIHCADVLTDIKSYDDYFFNTIFTDPPYNLGSKWEIGKDGFPIIKVESDFMDKWKPFTHIEWDEFFKECYRVLKWGGYCVMFGIDRQMFPIQYYAVKNSFEIQQSLYWYFISSFPKASDCGKLIDKRLGEEREVIGQKNPYIDNAKRKNQPKGEQGAHHRSKDIILNNGCVDITSPSSDLAKQFEGWKYSVSPWKQTVESIMIFKKPSKNKSTLDDIFEFEKDMKEKGYSDISPSVINIEEGRVPIKDGDTSGFWEQIKKGDTEKIGVDSWRKSVGEKICKKHDPNAQKIPNGRYPSQLFLLDLISSNDKKELFKIQEILKNDKN
jgi:hypothetical protein